MTRPCQLVLIALCAALATCQERGNLCSEQKTCGSCIQMGEGCGWCEQEGYDKDNKPRCDLVVNLISQRCDEKYVIAPEPKPNFISNLTVQDAKDGGEAIQVSPQEMSIAIRPRTPYKFQLSYKQAANYPVDLYFVMDLSQSMKDDKDKLAGLGDKIAENMNRITKNFRLGFGSFVDKKTMPYVSTIPSKLQSPCTDCVSPYSFHNQLRLTDDTSQFKTQVMNAPISGNLDAPEGGFDAIMQAIACKNDIGWRDQSRKMLVYSSDAAFHYAGDGKLGGIVTPNDGSCHMYNNYYTESLNQDYPSISQLANKIAEKKVNVIFAVTQSQKDVYEQLSKYIEGSVVGALANDSANIVQLIRKNYEKITSTVEMKTEGAEGVDVQFKSKCLGTELSNSGICANLSVGDNVTYEVTIEVEKCPEDQRQWNQTFKIYPVGLTEALTIHLNMICECNCEQPENEQKLSPRCNNTGTYECGACTCDDKHYGKFCECDKSNTESDDYDADCRKTNTSEICEGRGQCFCGTCDCNPITPGDPSKRFGGNFCECDDYSCDYSDGKLCGGPERGTCKCGTCMCNKNFNGTACECPISEEPCRAKNGLICNGKGVCKCGRCTCSLDTFYRGQTCEDCPTCVGRCDQNKECVQCKTFESGSLSKESCNANCSFVKIVDNIKDEPELRKMCQYRDDDDCMFYFAYEYSTNIVLAQRTKECPEPVNVLAIVLGVVCGIVAVGLALLLIWKLFTTIHDRREYAKFEKERKNAKWDTGENPIYKQATSTFKNPMYAGK